MRWMRPVSGDIRFVRSGFLLYPLLSVRPELWTVNCRTGKRVSSTSTACSFQRFVRSLYGTHSFCPLYCTSVTRTFVDRSLCVTCSVCMRPLRLPRRSLPPLRRLPSPDKHFLHIFCPFGVRYLYLFTRVIFYVRRIGLYLYKYRIYGTITIYILKGLAPVYPLILILHH